MQVRHVHDVHGNGYGTACRAVKDNGGSEKIRGITDETYICGTDRVVYGSGEDP